MNQKICKHPDGCQNRPSKCLAEGCLHPDAQGKHLSPEEVAAEKYLQKRYDMDYVPEHWTKAVAGYAAEKDEISKLKEIEKSLQLKEAQRIFVDYLTGKSSLRLLKADARIFLHNMKTTGSEAGKDGH